MNKTEGLREGYKKPVQMLQSGDKVTDKCLG